MRPSPVVHDVVPARLLHGGGDGVVDEVLELREHGGLVDERGVGGGVSGLVPGRARHLP